MLIVGSGGREHALAWRLARDGGHELHAAPGNPGIAGTATCHPVRADDGDGLLELATALGADLAVIGPEAPLVAGVGDRLRHGGFPVFGPSAAAARIEGSKSFAKEVLDAAGIPTARALSDPAPPCVVKADGLAAGKGVFVCRTQEELEAGLGAARAIGRPRRRRGVVGGRRAVGVRALRRAASLPARGGPRLQARRRRRHRAEHRRDGLLLAGSGVRLVRGRVARRPRPCSRGRRAGPARGTVHRRPLRRADADRGGPEGARVQLPVRRPGDAVAPAPDRRRPLGCARGGRGGRAGKHRSSASIRGRP